MIDSQDAALEDAELEDFDSAPLEDIAFTDDSYLRGMWSRRTYNAKNSTDKHLEDLVFAHGMVETFVNAFARDGRYAVSFDATASTAGTDLTLKRVVITPAPVADPNLSAEEAGLILTGLAVHEISHPRYGAKTASAVQACFPYNAVADALSNLLDDVRIEKRFVAEYPGYAGVFAPTLAYVGQSSVKANGGRKIAVRADQPVNLAIAAIRYPECATWTPETLAERAWYVEWAERNAREDAPARHVQAIREALRHIAAAKLARQNAGSGKSQPTKSAPASEDKTAHGDDSDEAPQGASSDTQSGADATSESSQDDENSESQSGSSVDADSQARADKMTYAELNEATTGERRQEQRREPSCAGSVTVEDAAKSDGVTKDDITKMRSEAEHAIAMARSLEDDGHGHKVDVAQSMAGLTRSSRKSYPSAMASRYIRNAIMQSRTGSEAVDSLKRHGRLDQRGLARIASGDVRIFERRTAPSPGKYNIWVMVDCSGSMAEALPEAASVAHALASACAGTPSVRMTVWGWTSAIRNIPAQAGATKVWTSGQPVDDVLKMGGLQTGGTPDHVIMGWATEALKRQLVANETPVIIFISDGEGDEGLAIMSRRVSDARKAGIVVKSVSFGKNFTARDQEERFGKGNFIPFSVSITATARPLASLVAGIVSK